MSSLSSLSCYYIVILLPCWGHVGAVFGQRWSLALKFTEFIMLCCDVFQRENDFGCFGFLLASGV